MDRERIAYLTLTQVPGMGSARLKTLLTACETAVDASLASLKFLSGLPGFSRAFATAIKSTPLESGRLLLERTAALGIEVLCPQDENFPASLRAIPEAPPVLFAVGDCSLGARPAIAIVGSRDHTGYGADVCRRLALAMARAGIVVVSGMARGLDAVAHTAALDGGGSTIGVLGNGHGVIYPAANRGLYQRVTEHGLLLSEFPPGERPHAGSFPRRNRLISGLSRVTVIVEAAVGSGALITAGTALDQGREVMAVPGNITSPVSVGANRLIRDGACPVLEPADLLQHYPEVAPALVQELDSVLATRPLPQNLSPEEREFAASLGGEPLHPDIIARRTERPIEKVLALLSSLEIEGVVEQRPGRLFRRV